MGTLDSDTTPRIADGASTPRSQIHSRQQPALTLFAIGLLGLGVLALIHGDFAMVWQPVPAFPGRTGVAYATGVLMLVLGLGLIFQTTAKWCVRILFPYLIAWAALKIPSLIAAPKMEAVWLGFGELTMMLAGGWFLFAHLGGIEESSRLGFLVSSRSLVMARLLFGVSLIPIGLSHLVYPQPTADLVPAWLPYRIGWAYLTGAGQIACGLGVLFSVLPRIAATCEAGMITLFTFLVWLPAVFKSPKERLPWTAFFISWIFGAAAWVVAQNTPSKKTAS